VHFTELVNTWQFDSQPTLQPSERPLLKFLTVNVAECSKGVLTGQRSEPGSLFEEYVGLASKQWHEVARGYVVHQREQLVTNTIPLKGQVVIGLIVHRCNTGLVNEFVKFHSSHCSKRLGGIVHHGRESVNAGTAHHVEQNCFSEVIHRVARE
jgi:hypothetical protein